MGIKVKGLTRKQHKIVKLVSKSLIEGKDINQTQIGLQVFDTDNPNSAGVMISKELKNAKVQQSIEEVAAAAGISSQTILNNFNHFAVQKEVKVTGETVLKANIELAKILGMYPDKKTAHLRVNLKGKIGNLPYNEAVKELKELQTTSSEFLNETGE